MQTFLLILILIILIISERDDILGELIKIQLFLKGYQVAWETCKGCGMSCHDENYMIYDSLWRKANKYNRRGRLCVGCLERRIGRELRPEDFLYHEPLSTSERLKSRRGPRPSLYNPNI